MEGDPSPALVIDVGSDEVTLSGPVTDGLEPEDLRFGRIPFGIWETLGAKWEDSVQDFLKNIGRSLEPLYLRNTGAVLERLLDEGEIYWQTIWGFRASHVWESISRGLMEHSPVTGLTKESDDFLERARSAPLVQVTCPADAILPLEMLPLGVRQTSTSPDTPEELFRAARLLGAFGCRLRYVILQRAGTKQSNASSDTGRLPQASDDRGSGVLFLRGIRSPLCKEIEEFFRGEPSLPLVVGPWPDAVLPVAPGLRPEDELALMMIKPTASAVFSGGQSRELAGCRHVYVNAHGRKGAGVGADFFFDFGKVRRWPRNPVKVDIVNVHRAVKAARKCGKEQHGHPLVFLNSCYSAGFGAELFTCSLMLLAGGAGSVVAARGETPAGFAIELAKSYYRFVGKEADPDEAILAARLELLAKTMNPLGAIYARIGSL